MPGWQTITDDISLCIGFYTVIPCTVIPVDAGEGHDRFKAAQWAAPIAGLVIAGAAAAAFTVAQFLGLAPSICAVLALGTSIGISGALHEDGLADTADGFGGGDTVERKLEIMRDSSIGTYGALALLLVFAIRLAALIALAAPLLVAAALISAHVASRAILPAFMRALPPARDIGLSAAASDIPAKSAQIALGLGALGLFASGPWTGLIALPLLALWFGVMRRLAGAQIKGQTGDVLGALQQGAEAIVLITASVLLV